MALVIDHTLDIEAPAEIVWQVLTDLASYGEWNPFVVACDSSLAVGTPIHMRVRVLPALAQPQTETVFEHEPGSLFSYGLAGNALGMLKSYRSHRLEVSGERRCRYQSHFELSGWLSPVVALAVGSNLRRGFSEMSAAIAKRAEELAAQA